MRERQSGCLPIGKIVRWLNPGKNEGGGVFVDPDPTPPFVDMFGVVLSEEDFSDASLIGAEDGESDASATVENSVVRMGSRDDESGFLGIYEDKESDYALRLKKKMRVEEKKRKGK